MNIPFTPDQFFGIFARYNEAVWPVQILLNLLALAAIAFIFRTRPWTDRAISVILSALWTWMAIAYHFAFFTSINPAVWGFGILFILGAIAFAYWGAFKGILRFGGGLSVLNTHINTCRIFTIDMYIKRKGRLHERL